MTTNRRAGGTPEQEVAAPPLLEAEAAAVLQRAHGHAIALGSTLDEAALVLTRAGLDDHARRLATLRELERMVASRVAVLVKRITEAGE